MIRKRRGDGYDGVDAVKSERRQKSMGESGGGRRRRGNVVVFAGFVRLAF